MGNLRTNDQSDATLSDKTLQKTYMHASGGMRTHKSRMQATADPCLSQRGRYDRPVLYVRNLIFVFLDRNLEDEIFRTE